MFDTKYLLWGIGAFLLYMVTTSDVKAEDAPNGIPGKVWRWKDDVERIADNVGFPYDTDWVLAQYWQESGGDPTAKPPGGGAGEVGLPQMTQIALDDVKDYFPDLASDLPNNVSGLEGKPMKQIKAGLLYDRANHERARQKGLSNPVQQAVRAHVEGPPPNTSASDNYWTLVSGNYESIKQAT
jgi:hypothetical protein